MIWTTESAMRGYLNTSEQWRKQAENDRRNGQPLDAHASLRRHIRWREQARALAKQEKKP